MFVFREEDQIYYFWWTTNVHAPFYLSLGSPIFHLHFGRWPVLESVLLTCCLRRHVDLTRHHYFGLFSIFFWFLLRPALCSYSSITGRRCGAPLNRFQNCHCSLPYNDSTSRLCSLQLTLRLLGVLSTTFMVALSWLSSLPMAKRLFALFYFLFLSVWCSGYLGLFVVLPTLFSCTECWYSV